jgi:hypothetical protein
VERHHEFAACCFWHGAASLPAPDPGGVVAIVFDFNGVTCSAPTSAVVPARFFAGFAARAPPLSS